MGDPLEMPALVGQLVATVEAEHGALIERLGEVSGVAADRARSLADQTPLGLALLQIIDARADLEAAAESISSAANQREGVDEGMTKNQDDLAALIESVLSSVPEDSVILRRRDDLLEIAKDMAAGSDAVSARAVALISSALSDLESAQAEEEVFENMEKSAADGGNLLPPSFYDQFGNVSDPAAVSEYLEKYARKSADASIEPGCRKALAKAAAGPSEAERALDDIAKRIYAEADGQITEFEVLQQGSDQNPDLAMQV